MLITSEYVERTGKDRTGKDRKGRKGKEKEERKRDGKDGKGKVREGALLFTYPQLPNIYARNVVLVVIVEVLACHTPDEGVVVGASCCVH